MYEGKEVCGLSDRWYAILRLGIEAPNLGDGMRGYLQGAFGIVYLRLC